MFDQTSHNELRGNGASTLSGWPESLQLERLRDLWSPAADESGQRHIRREMQTTALQDVPYISLGQFFQEASFNRSLSDVLKVTGALFHGVTRA